MTPQNYSHYQRQASANYGKDKHEPWKKQGRQQKFVAFISTNYSPFPGQEFCQLWKAREMFHNFDVYGHKKNEQACGVQTCSFGISICGYASMLA